MGTLPSRCVDGSGGGVGIESSGRGQMEDKQPIIEQDGRRGRGSSRRHSSGVTADCPTCQGTGRIPRGQESKFVAVIPCNDQRLKPRHTKLYVAMAVVVCLSVSFLVLFFLFPRSVVLSPLSVKSAYVNFTPNTIQMDITNILNITNQNFAPVQAYNLTVRALNVETVVGTVTVHSVTSIEPLSTATYFFQIPINLTDTGLNNYCRSTTTPVHILFLRLQMSMSVHYLAYVEQLFLDTYEYIDCGTNTTTPHAAQTSQTFPPWRPDISGRMDR